MMMTAKPEAPTRLLDMDEVAQRWGVSARTVARLVKKGRLRAVRIGRQVRFRLEDVLAYENRGGS
jgi:excisionase family DNA binding protein